MLLLVSSCKRHLGDPCDRPADCVKGLACLGDVVKKTCQDCAVSNACKLEGRCVALRGKCVDPGPTDNDNKEGGCPCGCDHSEALVRELERLPRDEALARVDDKLATIGAREEAGFVTDAMVKHRLRLLALAKRLGQPFPPPHAPSSQAVAERAARASLPFTEGGGLRVRTELIVHGQRTELVEDRPKFQRACFRLWLQLENTTGTELTVGPPSLDGSVPMPISRWYLEDTEGQPWNGLLRAGEGRPVLVIGYLDGSVLPGVTVTATVQLGSLAIPVSARARSRWNGDT